MSGCLSACGPVMDGSSSTMHQESAARTVYYIVFTEPKANDRH